VAAVRGGAAWPLRSFVYGRIRVKERAGSEGDFRIRKEWRMRTTMVMTMLVSLALFAGCEQTERRFTLNPDGSGKVAYTATFPLDIQSGPSMGQKKPKTDAEKVAAAKKKALTKSKGVAAWTNVSCKATDEGLIRFSGMAYFPDYNELAIASLGKGQEGKGPELTFEKTDAGYRIVGRVELNEKKDEAKTDTKPKTPAELQTELRRARTSWKYSKHMLGLVMANKKDAFYFHAPAKPVAVEGFEKMDKGYGFVFDGGKIYEAMDELMTMEDEKLLAILGEGVDLKDNEKAMEYVFAKVGFDPDKELVLAFNADKPLFDYEKEVAAAKQSYAKLLAKEGYGGAAKVATPQTASQGRVERVRVTRVSRSWPVRESARASAQFEVQVDFDGVVTKLGKIEVAELLSQQGHALLDKPKKVMQRNLQQDNKAARFSLRVPLEQNVQRIAKAAGTVTYMVGTGAKEVDLGVLETKKGAKAKPLEAEIRSVSGGWLKLAIAAEDGMVRFIKVYNPDGTPYEAKSFSGRAWQGKFQQTFRPAQGDDKWPPKLGFKVTLYTDSKAFTAPWVVENVTLPAVGE
jgi:hypothetical protein